MTLILNGTDNSATTPAVTGTDTDTGVYYPAANQVALATAGTQAMLVNATQGVQFNYGISVGGTAPSTDGTGVKFPATQVSASDANTLDDYEEGTWTPVLRGAGTAGSYTIAVDTNGARYTKVGRLVTLNCAFQLTSTVSSGTGYAQITGLPFSNAGQNSGSCYFGSVTVDALTLWCDVEFISANGQTTVYFNSIRNSAGSLDVDISGFATSCFVRFTLSYTTNN